MAAAPKRLAQQLPSIYTLEEIEKAATASNFAIELIDGIRDGFVALSKGQFFAAPIQTLGLPPFSFVETDGYAAQTCIKTGYFKGQDYYVVKVASGGHPLPNSGLMQVYCQKTGRLEALLLDDGLLTELRTAAAGALAAKFMAPKTIQKIGMVGTSGQARYQLDMLKSVTDCRAVLVWGRTATKVEMLCQNLNEKGWDTTPAENIDDLLQDCDLIITTTCSREPLLGKSTLETRHTGLHISCIGADAPGKVELNPQLVAKANLLVADSRLQSIERGEFQGPVSRGLIREDSIVPLGDFLQREELHRKSEEDNRLTIFDSSGVALQDCVISSLIVSKIGKKK